MHDSTRPNGHQQKRKIATARLRKILVGAAAATVTLTLSAGSPAMAAGSCANADTPASALTQDAAETAVMCLANSERALAGLAPLTRDATLAGDARTLAASSIMSAGLPATDTALWKPRYTTGTPAPSARDAMTTWMNNPVERAKIVDPRAVLAGAGIFLDKPVDLGPLTKEGNYVLKLAPPPPYIVNPCPGANTPVTQLTISDAEAAVLCLTNQKRAENNLAALTHNATLARTARSHAEKSARLQWWRTDDNGRASHDDPEVANDRDSGGRDLGHDIGGRIRAGGYCSQGQTWSASENTYTATGAPTPFAAVEWWYTHKGPDGTLATNEHRKTMLSTSYRELGVGVASGSAVKGEVAGATFVQHYGICG